MKIQGLIKFEKGKDIPQKVWNALSYIRTPFGKYWTKTKTFENKQVITSKKPGIKSVISKTAISKFGIRGACDIDDTTPSARSYGHAVAGGGEDQMFALFD